MQRDRPDQGLRAVDQGTEEHCYGRGTGLGHAWLVWLRAAAAAQCTGTAVMAGAGGCSAGGGSSGSRCKQR